MEMLGGRLQRLSPEAAPGAAGTLSRPAWEWELPPDAKPRGPEKKRSHPDSPDENTEVSHAVMEVMETREKHENPQLGLSGRAGRAVCFRFLMPDFKSRPITEFLKVR